MTIQCSWLKNQSTYFQTNGNFTTTITGTNFRTIVALTVPGNNTPLPILVTAFGPNGQSDQKVIDISVSL